MNKETKKKLYGLLEGTFVLGITGWYIFAMVQIWDLGNTTLRLCLIPMVIAPFVINKKG